MTLLIGINFSNQRSDNARNVANSHYLNREIDSNVIDQSDQVFENKKTNDEGRTSPCIESKLREMITIEMQMVHLA
jgi:hypothetical protein